MTWNHIIEVGSPEVRATITIQSIPHEEHFHLRTFRSFSHSVVRISLPPEHEWMMDQAEEAADQWLQNNDLFCDDYVRSIL